MQSISIAEVLLVIYVIVDDWYLVEGEIILHRETRQKTGFYR